MIFEYTQQLLYTVPSSITLTFHLFSYTYRDA